MLQKACLFLVLSLVLGVFAAAHGDEPDGHGEIQDAMHDESIRQATSRLVLVGGAVLAALVAAAAVSKRKKRKISPLFSYGLLFSIVAVVVAVTAYVAGSTIFLNVASVTGGPVHWHADFEIWDCGERVDLVNPQGLSNKVGSAVFHEHGDNRIHVEGVIVDRRDASLGEFLKVVGGEFRRGWLIVPTAGGEARMKDGDSCSGSAGTLQAFVWKELDGRIVQEKLGDYAGYVISPHGQVPPGDCVIIEFDSAIKERTERMCESYNAAVEKGALNGG